MARAWHSCGRLCGRECRSSSACRSVTCLSIRAVFDIQAEENAATVCTRQRAFRTVINVMVVQSTGANGLPTYLIQSRQSGELETVAMASLNWLSPDFGEIAVMTKPEYRRQGWGQSVVSSMVQYLLDNGRTPLYAVAETNEASIQLASSRGLRR